MERPTISYVIATYGRPEVLHATLRALRLQTVGTWEAVVVGDCCDDRTLAVIRQLDDPRIRYYNLPARYGEQGGPNSVGVTVANADWVAFLNHDDLLLPDHSRRVIDLGERENVDVVSTRFVSVKALHSIKPSRVDAEFGPVFPAARTTREVMTRRSYGLEPASAWAIRRPTALAVGPWRSWETVHRVPWHDWMLRILKTRARWGFDPTITGICVLTHHRGEGLLYDSPAAAHEQLVHAIATTPVDDLRHLLVLSGALDDTTDVSRRIRHRTEHLLGLGLLRTVGLDYATVWRTMRRRDPAVSARQALRSRTGENTVHKDRLPEYLHDPESLRIL